MTDRADPAPEWKALTAEWQARAERSTVSPAALRAHVHAETRHMRWGVIAEVALTVLVLAGTGWALSSEPDAGTWILCIDVWAVLAVVWTFAIITRRGTWRPLGESTTAYLALSRKRVQRRLWASRLVFLLVAAQLTVKLAVRYASTSAGSASATSVVVNVTCAVAWIAWATWSRRRALAELQRIDRLLAEFEGR